MNESIINLIEASGAVAVRIAKTNASLLCNFTNGYTIEVQTHTYLTVLMFLAKNTRHIFKLILRVFIIAW